MVLLPDAELCVCRRFHVMGGAACALRHERQHRTGYVNACMWVTGHLWQGRFSSAAMDEPHLRAAFRYVALYPVRARLVSNP